MARCETALALPARGHPLPLSVWHNVPARLLQFSSPVWWLQVSGSLEDLDLTSFARHKFHFLFTRSVYRPPLPHARAAYPVFEQPVLSLPTAGSVVEACGPFPPVASPPRSTPGSGGASQPPNIGWPREMASHHILHMGADAAKEEGRGESTVFFSQFPKASEPPGGGWLRLCNLRDKQVVTVRRKPAGLTWRAGAAGDPW